MKLPRDFYERADVTRVAKELLGKTLHTYFDNEHTVVRITEVEAYAGRNDKACHANNGLRTNRTEVMYHCGGYAYVYLCYGMHHLFNVVTNVKGMADAVLVRAGEPIEGVSIMSKRSNKPESDVKLTSGPGTLTQALGIKTKKHYGLDLLANQIWLEDAPGLNKNNIVTSTRIGVGYAEEDALKPWRFYIKNNQWISKK